MRQYNKNSTNATVSNVSKSLFRVGFLALFTTSILLSGCANMSRTQQRTLSGAAIGTAAGAAIGGLSGGSVGTGAAIGAVGGAATGYAIDRY